MDMSQVGQVTGWIQQQFGNQQTISKDELTSKAQSSDLPQEAKQSMQDLPQGTWSKDELVDKVKGMMMQKAGGGAGGRGGMGGFGLGG